MAMLSLFSSLHFPSSTTCFGECKVCAEQSWQITKWAGPKDEDTGNTCHCERVDVDARLSSSSSASPFALSVDKTDDNNNNTNNNSIVILLCYAVCQLGEFSSPILGIIIIIVCHVHVKLCIMYIIASDQPNRKNNNNSSGNFWPYRVCRHSFRSKKSE